MRKKINITVLIIDIIFILIDLFTVFSREILGYSVRFWVAKALSIGFIIIANGSFVYYIIITRNKTFNKIIYKIINIIAVFCIGTVILVSSITEIYALAACSKYGKEYIVIEEGDKYIMYEDPFFGSESKYEYGNMFFRGKEIYEGKN